jgi:hypothetical protein
MPTQCCGSSRASQPFWAPASIAILRSCSGEPIWKRPVGSSTSSGPLPLAVEEAVAQHALRCRPHRVRSASAGRCRPARPGLAARRPVRRARVAARRGRPRRPWPARPCAGPPRVPGAPFRLRARAVRPAGAAILPCARGALPSAARAPFPARCAGGRAPPGALPAACGLFGAFRASRGLLARLALALFLLAARAWAFALLGLERGGAAQFGLDSAPARRRSSSSRHALPDARRDPGEAGLQRLPLGSFSAIGTRRLGRARRGANGRRPPASGRP